MFADDIILYMDFPGGSDLKECSCNVRDLGSIPRLGDSTRKRNGYPTPVFLPGESCEERNLAGYSLCSLKESEVTEQLTLSLNSVYIENPKNSTKNCSVQLSRSVMSDSLKTHESQHARPPVHHQLPGFTQIHVHRVNDAIQPSHLCHPLLLLPPIPPSIRVFSSESALPMRWPKY